MQINSENRLLMPMINYSVKSVFSAGFSSTLCPGNCTGNWRESIIHRNLDINTVPPTQIFNLSRVVRNLAVFAVRVRKYAATLDTRGREGRKERSSAGCFCLQNPRMCCGLWRLGQVHVRCAPLSGGAGGFTYSPRNVAMAAQVCNKMKATAF